eukprot:scaffold18714_cov69-Phaeocystis_antarctica.AAC.4
MLAWSQLSFMLTQAVCYGHPNLAVPTWLTRRSKLRKTNCALRSLTCLHARPACLTHTAKLLPAILQQVSSHTRTATPLRKRHGKKLDPRYKADGGQDVYVDTVLFGEKRAGVYLDIGCSALHL